MYFDYSSKDRALEKEVKDFSLKEIAPMAEEIDRSNILPPELVTKIGKQGFFGVGYPKEIGGRDGDTMSQCILIETLTRFGSASTSGIVVIQCGLSIQILHRFGTQEQKESYMMPNLKGDKIGSFALTEAAAGSDVLGMQSSAHRDGRFWVLNRGKSFAGGAAIADYIMVTVYTDRGKRSKGMSTFIVDKGIPGLKMRRMDLAAERGGETGEFSYEGCRLPETKLVGNEGDGFHMMMETLARSRILNSARAVGIAAAGLDLGLEYAKDRTAFGSPIGKFQAISFRLAEMAMEVEAARLLMQKAAWLCEQGRPCLKESSMAKLFASEAASKVTRQALQIHASKGFLQHSRMNRYFQDGQAATIVEGTSEIQKLVIAREIGL